MKYNGQTPPAGMMRDAPGGAGNTIRGLTRTIRSDRMEGLKCSLSLYPTVTHRGSRKVSRSARPAATNGRDTSTTAATASSHCLASYTEFTVSPGSSPTAPSHSAWWSAMPVITAGAATLSTYSLDRRQRTSETCVRRVGPLAFLSGIAIRPTASEATSSRQRTRGATAAAGSAVRARPSGHVESAPAIADEHPESFLAMLRFGDLIDLLRAAGYGDSEGAP